MHKILIRCDGRMVLIVDRSRNCFPYKARGRSGKGRRVV
jgi:hypothetical protein